MGLSPVFVDVLTSVWTSCLDSLLLLLLLLLPSLLSLLFLSGTLHRVF